MEESLIYLTDRYPFHPGEHFFGGWNQPFSDPF